MYWKNPSWSATINLCCERSNEIFQLTDFLFIARPRKPRLIMLLHKAALLEHYLIRQGFQTLFYLLEKREFLKYLTHPLQAFYKGRSKIGEITIIS